ncbi:MAG: hypothetical protein ACFFD4_22780 [Candidatus Odinarchaeota archaeon]
MTRCKVCGNENISIARSSSLFGAYCSFTCRSIDLYPLYLIGAAAIAIFFPILLLPTIAGSTSAGSARLAMVTTLFFTVFFASIPAGIGLYGYQQSKNQNMTRNNQKERNWQEHGRRRGRRRDLPTAGHVGNTFRPSPAKTTLIERQGSNTRRLLKKTTPEESKKRWLLAKEGDTCWSCGALLKVETPVCEDCGSKRIICFICRRNIDRKSRIGACPACNNHFHFEHLRETVKMIGKCPMCKMEVKMNDVIELGVEVAIEKTA